MVGSFILFTLIVIVPYYLYFRKRYKESNDKQLYLQEKLYQSTIWIILLVAAPFMLVNFFMSEPEYSTASFPKYSSYSIEDFVEKREEQKHDQQFLLNYIGKFHSLANSTIRKNELKDFFQSLIQNGERDLGHWALGQYHYGYNTYDSALYYFSLIENEEFPYRNLSLARTYSKVDADSLVEEYLLKEVEIVDGNQFQAYEILQSRLENSENLNLLLEIIQRPNYEQYINYQLVRKILLLNFEATLYYQVIVHWFVRDMNITGATAALLILIVWVFFLLKLNFFERLSWTPFLVVLVLGMIFSFFTFLISDVLTYNFGYWEGFDGFGDLFVYCVLGIGSIEEFVKIAPVLLVYYILRSKIQPYEYILYACASALGFAFIENIMYFEQDSFGVIIHGRALTAAVGHMTFSSIFAYGFILAKFKYKKLPMIGAFFIFWFLASLTHGLYDFWIFAGLGIIFIPFFFVIVRIWITLINNALNNSSNFIYSGKFQTKTLQFQLSFLLTAILMFEYLVVAFTEGPSSANSNLTVAAFSGSFLIMFLGSKLTSLNLIKGYWTRINYSINPFTDDVISQNFIGQKVYFNSYYPDRGLVEYMNDGISGIIVARQVVLNRRPTFLFSNEDSEWFLVKLSENNHLDDYVPNYAMIKFKENHSSLNARKFFLVNLLLIPKKLPSPKMLRKNFHSIGWTFLRTSPLED